MTTPNEHVPAPGPLPSGSGSVLVVDDEEMIRRLARIILGRAGYRVEEACTAAAVVDAVRNASPHFDLVILDLTLPDGHGGSVIPEIRRHSPLSRVLVVSGLGESSAAETEADGFLAKPFTRPSLLTAVHQVLGTRPTEGRFVGSRRLSDEGRS